jgi:predicted nucleic acid-binding protein
MLAQPRTGKPICFSDKKALKSLMDELNRQLGIVPDPDITIEKLRQMMRTEGMHPEENALSREVLRMRNGEE